MSFDPSVSSQSGPRSVSLDTAHENKTVKEDVSTTARETTMNQTAGTEKKFVPMDSYTQSVLDQIGKDSKSEGDFIFDAKVYLSTRGSEGLYIVEGPNNQKHAFYKANNKITHQPCNDEQNPETIVKELQQKSTLLKQGDGLMEATKSSTERINKAKKNLEASKLNAGTATQNSEAVAKGAGKKKSKGLLASMWSGIKRHSNRSKPQHFEAIDVENKKNLKDALELVTDSSDGKPPPQRKKGLFHVLKTSRAVKKQYEMTVKKTIGEDLSELNLTEKQAKKLTKTSKRLKAGKAKVVKIDDKKFLLRKGRSSTSREKTFEIHVIAVNTFASGAYGEIRGAKKYGTGEAEVVEKTAKLTTRGAAEDVKNEYKMLRKIHKRGKVKGIQEPPYKAVLIGGKSILGIKFGEKIGGFIGKRYDGDGTKLTEKLHDPGQKSEAKPVALIAQLNEGLGNLLKLKLYDFDRKLENTLYTENDGNVELVLADFGGCRSFSEVEKLAAKAYSLRKDPDALETAVMKLRGVQTGKTSCDDDHARLEEIISHSKSKKEAIANVHKFMEQRLVFSQAVSSLQLLTGKDPLDLKGILGAGWTGVRFKHSDVDSFKRALLEAAETTDDTSTMDSEALSKAVLEKFGLNDEQVQMLFKGLNNNADDRPSLEEFSLPFAK